MDELASISEENQNQDGYSDEALNHTVAETKQEIAKQKQENGDLSEEEVKNIVDEKLKSNGLNKVLNDNQINTINNIMVNVSDSKVMNNDPKAFEKQAKDLSNSIKDKAGDLIDKAKGLNTDKNRNFLQKIWDAIVEFIMSIVNAIKSFF